MKIESNCYGIELQKWIKSKRKSFVLSNRWQRNAIEHWNRTLITRKWVSKSVKEVIWSKERSESLMLKNSFPFFSWKTFIWNASCKRSLICLRLFFLAFYANYPKRVCLLVPMQSINVIEHRENELKTKRNGELKTPYENRKVESQTEPNAVMSTCGK